MIGSYMVRISLRLALLLPFAAAALAHSFLSRGLQGGFSLVLYGASLAFFWLVFSRQVALTGGGKLSRRVTGAHRLSLSFEIVLLLFLVMFNVVSVEFLAVRTNVPRAAGALVPFAEMVRFLGAEDLPGKTLKVTFVGHVLAASYIYLSYLFLRKVFSVRFAGIALFVLTAIDASHGMIAPALPVVLTRLFELLAVVLLALSIRSRSVLAWLGLGAALVIFYIGVPSGIFLLLKISAMILCAIYCGALRISISKDWARMLLLGLAVTICLTLVTYGAVPAGPAYPKFLNNTGSGSFYDAWQRGRAILSHIFLVPHADSEAQLLHLAFPFSALVAFGVVTALCLHKKFVYIAVLAWGLISFLAAVYSRFYYLEITGLAAPLALLAACAVDVIFLKLLPRFFAGRAKAAAQISLFIMLCAAVSVSSLFSAPLSWRRVLPAEKNLPPKIADNRAILQSLQRSVSVEAPQSSVLLPPEAGAAITIFEGGSGELPGQFKDIMGIAVDQEGNIWAADMGNHRIQKFDSKGAALFSIGKHGAAPGEFNEPRGIALDEAGNLYVMDSWNSRIQKFDRSGKFIGVWGSPGGFYGGKGISVRRGRVYTTDSGNGRIEVFNTEGKHLATWGRKGSQEGEFLEPSGIAAGSSEHIYIVDSGNDRIQKLAPDGSFVMAWPVEGWSAADLKEVFIECGPDDVLYLADTVSSSVITYSTDGKRLNQLSGISFEGPTGVALFGRDIFVSERGPGRVRKEVIQ